VRNSSGSGARNDLWIDRFSVNDIGQPLRDHLSHLRIKQEHAIVVVYGHAVAGRPLEGIVGTEFYSPDAEPFFCNPTAEVWNGFFLSSYISYAITVNGTIFNCSEL
jgi:hypothetical protein